MADIVLIAVIVLFALHGAKRGFARSLVGIISTVLSLVISMVLYRPVSLMLYESQIGDSVRGHINGIFAENVQGAASFIINAQSGVDAVTMLAVNALSFIVVILLSKIIVSAIAGAINIAARLPLVKQANSLLGMALGVISGVLVCYIIIGVIAALGANMADTVKMIEESMIASMFCENNLITNVLAAFMK